MNYDPLRMFLNEKEEVLRVASDERLIPLLDYSMCANPHLLNVLKYTSVVWTVHFFRAEPHAEEAKKILIRCCTAPIVRVVEDMPYFRAREEVIAHA